MMENIYSVSALTEILRDTLEKRLPFVWVRGEITNLSRPGSGHIYFTLKDERAQLQCVWFAHKRRLANGKFDPLTGEVYEKPQTPVSEILRNGMELLCAGSMSVYPARGQYQLLIELVQACGEGVLAQEFEKLKLRLSEAGYFKMERKRPLPFNPARVALITSPKGAAIHDFLELAQTRGTGAEIRLYPVPVQGAGAAEQIAAMIYLINSGDWAQVITIIRGGGSLEDLWSFNEEGLAKAIFDSRIPVLAGIGHEVDFTLSDMTADMRAATPSHAAQILWPSRCDFWQKLDNLDVALSRASGNRLDTAEKELARLEKAMQWLSPGQKLARFKERIDELSQSLGRETGLLLERYSCALEISSQREEAAVRQFVEKRAARLDEMSNKLEALNPAAPLRRGYAYLYNDQGAISSVLQISSGQSLNAMLADGKIALLVGEIERNANLAGESL